MTDAQTSPEPYFTDGRITLYLGDCREILPELGLTADLIVTDPPYGETSLKWDRWVDGWPALAATAARSMWAFGSMRMFGEHWAEFTAAGWRMSQDVIGSDEDGDPVFGDVHVVWEKTSGSSRAADRFKRTHEHALLWYRGQWTAVHHEPQRHVPRGGPRSRTKIGEGVRKGMGDLQHTGEYKPGPSWIDDGTRLMTSVITTKGMRHRAIHHTEKPLDLLRPLIEYACPPGGLVLDLFAGSGAILDAARQTGRRAIGIEADPKYAERAAKRLSQGVLDLGGAA